MKENLESLKQRKQELYQQLDSFGDFRPGTIAASFRKCGKKRCACAQKDHPGHGPQYLCTTKRNGKSIAQYLRLGPELEKAELEVSAYQRFEAWRHQVIEVNEKICRLKPVRQIDDEQEFEALKKKLQRRFLPRQDRKSTA